MTQSAKSILEAFDSLPAAEREEVMAELIRRATRGDHEAPSDEEFIAAADRVFLELDRRESES
jgi:hypothetical protein